VHDASGLILERTGISVDPFKAIVQLWKNGRSDIMFIALKKTQNGKFPAGKELL
jgi:hypothetical protein